MISILIGDSVWKVLGYNEFSSEWYGLGSYPTEKAAQSHAKKKLEELERHQPTSSSGGQGYYGIQDRVWIERPDGTKYRVFPD